MPKSLLVRGRNRPKGVRKQMKRLMIAAFLLMAGIVLFACEKKSEEQQNTKEPVASPLADGTATSGAINAKEPVLSGTEAFDQAEELVKGMTLEEKVGQLFLVSLSQLDNPKEKRTSYNVTKKMKDKIAKYHLGGVILQKENIRSQKQTQELVTGLKSAASGGAVYVAVTEECGGENSVSADCPALTAGGYMTPEEMGNNMSELQIREKGKSIGEELSLWGLNLNLAPVADICKEENDIYRKRCLGEDPSDTADLLTALVEGMKEGGLSVTLKYFPGYGNIQEDVNQKIVKNDISLMQLRNRNFILYSAGIKAGADCVMVGNTHLSKITPEKRPAFMAQEVVTSLLREELGFGGVIMTSPLNQPAITNEYTTGFAVIEALKAGCDVLVQPLDLDEAYQTILSEVQSGRLDEKVINTAVRRILQNKIQQGILVLNNK